jgi:hypothetical protein
VAEGRRIRPRALTFIGRFLVVVGVLNLCGFALFRIGQVAYPGFAAGVRAFPIYVPVEAVASALLNGIVYTFSGVGILRGKAWAAWTYVVYVPALALLVLVGRRHALSLPEAFWVVPYIVFVVLLMRRSSRVFLG